MIIFNSCIHWRWHQLSKAINLGGLVRGGYFGLTNVVDNDGSSSYSWPRSNAMTTTKRTIPIRIILQLSWWIERRPSYRTINDCDSPTLYPRVPIAIPPGLVRSRLVCWYNIRNFPAPHSSWETYQSPNNALLHCRYDRLAAHLEKNCRSEMKLDMFDLHSHFILLFHDLWMAIPCAWRSWDPAER